MSSTNLNMAYKDFSLIPSPKTDFFQIKIEDGGNKIRIKKDASQKLIQ